MRKVRTYLDFNATSPLNPHAREAMMGALSAFGNPSSVHAEGREARRQLELARSQVAQAFGVKSANIVFNSGASEGASHVLSPEILAGGAPIPVSRLYVSAIEHPCVLSGGRFDDTAVQTLPVTEAGILDLNALERALNSHDASQGAAMVAVMAANNETGAVQPLERISELVHAAGAFLMVDAVQALGKLPFDMASTGAHFAIVSSHKIGGPRGAGAVLFADDSILPTPLIPGGAQENQHRAGTENLPAIAGFAAALKSLDIGAENLSRMADIRDSMERDVSTICNSAGNKVGEPVFFASESPRLANTSCFAIPGLRAETALISLDLDGIAVSSGSACTSGRVGRSHVLVAMGVEDELAQGALRVSLGPDTTKDDTGRFLSALETIVSRVA